MQYTGKQEQNLKQVCNIISNYYSKWAVWTDEWNWQNKLKVYCTSGWFLLQRSTETWKVWICELFLHFRPVCSMCVYLRCFKPVEICHVACGNTFIVCVPSLQVDYALIASQAGATLNNLLSHAQELVSKLRSLQLDQREFVCLKFLVLFSLGE